MKELLWVLKKNLEKGWKGRMVADPDGGDMCKLNFLDGPYGM